VEWSGVEWIVSMSSLLRPLLRIASRKVPMPDVVASWFYGTIRNQIYPDKREALFDAVFNAVTEGGGDYLEFGVFRGTSFILASKMAKRHRLRKTRFFAFDSFQGLPESEGTKMKKGEWAAPRVDFERTIRQAGVDMTRVVIVEGLYNVSLDDRVKQRYQLAKAAVVHVDSDLYSSAKDVLRFVEDVIVPGTILIFDNWYSFRNDEAVESRGERRAFREWRLKDSFVEFHDIPNHSKAFLMRN